MLARKTFNLGFYTQTHTQMGIFFCKRKLLMKIKQLSVCDFCNPRNQVSPLFARLNL
jgi:hypothetical protein